MWKTKHRGFKRLHTHTHTTGRLDATNLRRWFLGFTLKFHLLPWGNGSSRWTHLTQVSLLRRVKATVSSVKFYWILSVSWHQPHIFSGPLLPFWSTLFSLFSPWCSTLLPLLSVLLAGHSTKHRFTLNPIVASILCIFFRTLSVIQLFIGSSFINFLPVFM